MNESYTIGTRTSVEYGVEVLSGGKHPRWDFRAATSDRIHALDYAAHLREVGETVRVLKTTTVRTKEIVS